ncbi:MAG: amidohydrolase family protein [Myxococcales bacterium]|nr:amidohydrolase family protein [Myxococcales bacterium]
MVDAEGCIICPGWVNAHDHLDLSVYPRLAPNAPYSDGHAWGMDVLGHIANNPKWVALGTIPLERRLAWGVLRNLLHGVTTVSHHNAPPDLATRLKLPIRLHTTRFWVHSVREIRRLHRMAVLAKTLRQPLILHAAEAVSGLATREIAQLFEWGSINDHTILVHAVSASPDELDSIRKKNAALVTCVTSNQLVLGNCADLSAWNGRKIRSGLGTDSPLTAVGGMLDEIQAAVTLGGLSSTDALRWATVGGAQVLRLRVGRLCPGWPADFVVYRARATCAEELVWLRPDQVELVCVRGKPELTIGARKNEMEQLGRTPKSVVVGGNEVWVDSTFADCLGNFNAIHPAGGGTP